MMENMEKFNMFWIPLRIKIIQMKKLNHYILVDQVKEERKNQEPQDKNQNIVQEFYQKNKLHQNKNLLL